jgi:hypothetical protein
VRHLGQEDRAFEFSFDVKARHVADLRPAAETIAAKELDGLNVVGTASVYLGYIEACEYIQSADGYPEPIQWKCVARCTATVVQRG